jgi:hypothetical protein
MPSCTIWQSVPNAGPFTIWRTKTKRASPFECPDVHAYVVDVALFVCSRMTKHIAELVSLLSSLQGIVG